MVCWPILTEMLSSVWRAAASATASHGCSQRLLAGVSCAAARLGAGSPCTGALRRHLFGQTFDVGEMHASRRRTVGSRQAQASRSRHEIPGIVYGHGPLGSETTDLVFVHESDLRREVNKRKDAFYNTLFDLCVRPSRGAGALGESGFAVADYAATRRCRWSSREGIVSLDTIDSHDLRMLGLEMTSDAFIAAV